jgi:hypothetical protein
MLTILLTTAVFAQAPEETEVEVIIPQETFIDFGDQEVIGKNTRPQIDLIVAWTPANGESLIKVRTSFQTEINASIDNVK